MVIYSLSNPIIFLIFFLFVIADGAQLILVNNCNESIWPGMLGGAGHPTPKDGGFQLSSGEESVIDVPEKWSGRVWARQVVAETINETILVSCKISST